MQTHIIRLQLVLADEMNIEKIQSSCTGLLVKLQTPKLYNYPTEVIYRNSYMLTRCMR